MKRKNKTLRRLRHLLTAPAVRAVVFCCAFTPIWLLRFNARILGYILSLLPLSASDTISEHRRTVMASLGIKASSSAIYSSVLTSYFDFFHYSGKSDKAFMDMVRVKGSENMTEALDHGKGAIAVTAHFSAWELIPRAVKLLGFETGVVGRSLTHPGASSILEHLRAAPGIHVVDRDKGVSPIVRLLRSNTAVGILIDQYTSRVQSHTVDFLGVPASTPVAPAVLARRLGVPVVPLHIERLRDSSYLLQIEKPMYFDENDSDSEILDLLNRKIGNWIRNSPEQWVWFHKRWKGFSEYLHTAKSDSDVP